MIKVLIRGTEVYKLYFRRRQYSRTKTGQPLMETVAIVGLAGAKRDEPAVAEAASRQYHKDTGNKEHARVAALRHLLATDTREKSPTSFIGPTFNREERSAIWKAYWNRANGQSKAPVLPTPAAAHASTVDAPRPAAARPKSLPLARNTHPVVSRPTSRVLKFPTDVQWVAAESSSIH